MTASEIVRAVLSNRRRIEMCVDINQFNFLLQCNILDYFKFLFLVVVNAVMLIFVNFYYSHKIISCFHGLPNLLEIPVKSPLVTCKSL